jgi:hypothetical protein
MSKRSLDESPSSHSSKSIQPVTTAESTNSSNDGAGLRPILELLSPAEEQADQHGGHVKKPRNFIATVVIPARFDVARSGLSGPCFPCARVTLNPGLRELPTEKDQVR